MSIKTILLVALLNIDLMGAESTYNLASSFSALPIEQKVADNLPKGRESEILEALFSQHAYSTLLRLNYKPAIEKVVGSYLAAEGRDAGARKIIAKSGSPYVIDELAPALYKGEEVKMRVYGEHADMDGGESTAAAGIIGELIVRAPEFSSEVKAWAKQELHAPEYSLPENPNIIRSARAWWETNQAALLANKFDQVTLPQATPSTPPPAPTAPTSPPPEPPSPPITPPPHPVPAKPAATAPASAPVAPPAPQKSTAVWWIVCLVIVLGGVGLVVRNRKPHR